MSHIKSGDLIFVYGTLMKGERASLYEQANQFGVAFVGDDEVSGVMYNLGSFPGVKNARDVVFDGGAPRVIGEVYRVLDEKVGHRLDHYEGYPSLYTRRQVMTAKGRKAWVYEYALAPRGDVIQSGDWRKRTEASPPTATRPASRAAG